MIAHLTLPPPLTLYIHVPWCRRKCPYCDFNSYAATAIPETQYIAALLAQLDAVIHTTTTQRPLTPLIAIFIGGGTPSLLSGDAVAQLLSGIRARLSLTAECEITLELNPGAVDIAHLNAYLAAGVTRLSIGVQSLSAFALRQLKRIHRPADVINTVTAARAAGCRNLNLDVMYGLPHQSLAQARIDLQCCFELTPEHVSYYQLTLEPGTAFAQSPPPGLPDDDLLADMSAQGQALIAAAGWPRYEISAYAAPNWHCRHNVNYWTFGDYLAIGAGAHGKISTFTAGRVQQVTRYVTWALPADYFAAYQRGHHWYTTESVLSMTDVVLEFALNALRLTAGVPLALFTARTGITATQLTSARTAAQTVGLLMPTPQQLQATARGLDCLNDLLQYFTGD